MTTYITAWVGLLLTLTISTTSIVDHHFCRWFVRNEMKRVFPLVTIPLVRVCISCLLQLPPLLQSARQRGLLVDHVFLSTPSSLEPTPTPCTNNSDAKKKNDNNQDKNTRYKTTTKLYILGTVHLGSISAKEATVLIQTVKPRTVILEMSPTRMDRLSRQRRTITTPTNDVDPTFDTRNITEDRTANATTTTTTTTKNNPLALLPVLWVLASKGWSNGGVIGFLLATTMMWTSIVKRSWTIHHDDDEEGADLRRVDEFVAAWGAARTVGADVVAADVELDALLRDAARSISWIDICRLGSNVAWEGMGLAPSDPIQRRSDESVHGWLERRRNIETSRASRRHGARQCPSLSRVLVDHRDERISRMIRAERHRAHDTRPTSHREGEEGEEEEEGEDNVMVCVVGLVHLDGIVERLSRQNQDKG